MRRLLLGIGIILGLFGSPALAQNAEDLIRLTVRQIANPASDLFDEQARNWIAGEGREEIFKVRSFGPIKAVTLTNDHVRSSVWTATGRAEHEKGYSDWEIVYSAKPAKVTRIAIKATSPGQPLAERLAFSPPRAMAVAPSTLNPCTLRRSLCNRDGLKKRDDGPDPRVVEFLYATSREPTPSTERVAFSEGRGKALSFGAARVRVPEDHRIGQLELPSSVRFAGMSFYEQSTEPEKHFVIKQVKAMTRAEWDDIVRQKSPDEALVFVHGFNTSFEESIYRTAQLAWDLQYSGLMVAFSWASRGGMLNYAYDQQSALIANAQFIELLDILKRQHGIKRVHVLAHSMGNFLVVEALSENARSANPLQLSELIMAAPDVDRDHFLAAAPSIRKIVSGMTLYASSADKALLASKQVAVVPRAGDVPPEGPLIMAGMETIDVTAIGQEFLGLNHNVFAATRSVMNDIGILLTSNPRKAPHHRLLEVRRVPEFSDPPKYWRYVP